MKKFHLKFLALALLPALVLGGCRAENNNSSVFSSFAESSFVTDANEENTSSELQTEQTVKGTVTGLTAAVITVTAEDGNVYLFTRDDSVLDTAGGGIMQGAAVTVTYIGQLVKSESAQHVRITNILAEKPVQPSGSSAVSKPQEESKPTVSSKPAEPSKPSNPPEPAKKRDAETILAGMTLEEKAAQLFIARCPAKNAAQTAQKYQFGGYILFARDFESRTRAQVAENIKSYQSVSKIPMFIGVDEEGGKVNRVSKFPQFRAEPFLSPQDLYKKGGFPLVKSDTKEKSGLLKSLGINLNFAPVCDVSLSPSDYIYPRTFGRSAAETAEYIRTVVTEMKSNRMGSVLKHFPGYGSNIDTHGEIAVDGRSLESFRQNDFLPFKSGIESGADVVLVSHNIVTAMDAEKPASLSPAVHDILRNELGFKGLVITDDLSMGAITKKYGAAEAAVMAVTAGNDLLCSSDYDKQYPAVLSAVKSGRIPESRINESVLRILNCKISLGIIS